MDLSTLTNLGPLGLLVIGIACIGSALGIGKAGVAAGACWAAEGASEGGKLNFIYVVLLSMPISQVIYAFIIMKALQPHLTNPEHWALCLAVGVSGGLAEAASAFGQGAIGASACICIHESKGKGLAFNIIAMGVAETVGIFAMVFLMMVLPR